MDISVVIPLYNKAAFIERAVRSVLSQSVPVAEVIIVDDGSTDNGAELVTALSNNKVTLHSQSNNGVSSARNIGVSLCSSPFVAFLDADDYWHEHFIAEIKALNNAQPDAKLLCTGYEFSTQHSRANAVNTFMSEQYGILADYFAACSLQDLPITSSSVCIEKSSLLEIGGFPEDLSLGEDQVVWAKMACKWPVAYANKVSAVYDLAASVSEKPQVDYVKPSPHLKAFEQLLVQGVVPSKMQPTLKYLMHLTVMSSVKRNLLKGRKKEAFNLLVHAPLLQWDWYRAFAFLLVPLPQCCTRWLLSSNKLRRFNNN
ncbi:glycosyltransferase [Pseudoalteromonas sp. MMG013]|uniref:glycosyltransferase family 2 protein n=1 Tax=Pseudoalteromonas sp. MMG013 TaxID=2822687 RepID=UPI001B3885D2|nr:glycosyltransferase family 2 protein [Pseudoalteromonas sp. MMG013]MBQ4860854.1 glycosyltransferase [Pseudoalteromonas sp. MMG013]